MPRRKKNYQVGDWFLVPLIGGGSGLGIVARDDDGILLGYFFPEVYNEIPLELEIRKLQPSDAILIKMLSDLHLLKNIWTVIFHTEDFKPSDWPLPKFGNLDIVDPSRAYITRYPDDNIGDIGDMWEVKPNAILGLPKAGLAGAGAIESSLNRLLHPENGTDEIVFVTSSVQFSAPISNFPRQLHRLRHRRQRY